MLGDRSIEFSLFPVCGPHVLTLVNVYWVYSFTRIRLILRHEPLVGPVGSVAGTPPHFCLEEP